MLAGETCEIRDGRLLIPEGIYEIREHEFEYRTDFTEVSLPSSLKRIGKYAFYATRLKTVELPENLKEIGDYAFSGCAVNHVELHGGKEGNRIWGKSLFRYCRWLETVELKGMKKIPEGLFYDCSLLRHADMDEETEKIGCRAFAGCIALSEIRFPSCLKNIGEGAFLGCESLKELDFPEQLESIEKNAFFHCHGLKSVRLPKQLRSLGTRAFAGNRELRWIAFDGKCDDLSVFGRKDTLTGCSALERIIAPKIPVLSFYRDYRQAAALGFAEYYVNRKTGDKDEAPRYLEYFEREKERFLPLLLQDKPLLQIFMEHGWILPDMSDKLAGDALKQDDIEIRTMLLEYQEQQTRTEYKWKQMEDRLARMLEDL